MKRKVYIVKDILSGPVVKTSPSNAGGMASIPSSLLRRLERGREIGL